MTGVKTTITGDFLEKIEEISNNYKIHKKSYTTLIQINLHDGE